MCSSGIRTPPITTGPGLPPFFGRVLFEQIGEVPDQVWDRGGRPGGGDGDDKDETTGQSIFQFYKIVEFY